MQVSGEGSRAGERRGRGAAQRTAMALPRSAASRRSFTPFTLSTRIPTPLMWQIAKFRMAAEFP